MQKVRMYTTAVCPYCIRAKQLLLTRGVEVIEEIRVDLEPERREEMMQNTKYRSAQRAANLYWRNPRRRL